jgi:hypothetical protein
LRLRNLTDNSDQKDSLSSIELHSDTGKLINDQFISKLLVMMKEKYSEPD